ncbi:MAG: heme-copper oxidase subunit III [Anaerolineales bacterium]|nr:heme-copper oxidase subunit III [Anaerolineales bacterium]MCB9112934.1 heme-copper oxidase subunit III [Anaerolineales bacterium]
MSEMEGQAPVIQRENTKLAMWVFLGGEVVFFVSLILLIIFTRLTNSGYEEQFRSHLSIPIIALNTFILVTSSYFVVRALEAISFKGDRKALRNNLIMVIVLGLLFLGGQAFEWTSLFGEGVNLSSTYGSPFFTVTGIHGTHVFVGILWAVYLLVGHRRKPFTQDNHLGIENFGLYWHFVDIVWIVLFTVIYLI